jgi:Xaa-Pro dipeptidase
MFGAVSVSSGKSTLFIPRLPDSWRIWCGQIYPPAYFKEMYQVDEVLFVEDLPTWLEATLEAEGSGSSIHLLKGINSDSGLESRAAEFEGIDKFASRLRTDVLHHCLSSARVCKSPLEVSLMRYCAYVASNAHVKVMQSISPGMTEYELEATFQYEIYRNGGCRRVAYTSICACGPNAATLHYGHAGAPNDRELLPTDMVCTLCVCCLNFAGRSTM